jgi:NADH-ubiquinone oxidoreductase chain 2
MLLALSVCSIESIQAFIFYLMQYSVTNLNAFIILIAMGLSLYYYTSKNKEHKNLLDKNNSPIQLINQLKGYFYINPILSLSFIITIFSFAGIPPLIGFFAKQMVLSAALDSGFIFMSFIAIITSIIGAVYYLIIVKNMFFYSPVHKISTTLSKYILYINKHNNNITFSYKNITVSSSVAITISILTLGSALFMFINKE